MRRLRVYLRMSRGERQLFWRAYRVLRVEERGLRTGSATDRLGTRDGDVDAARAAAIGTAVRRAAVLTRSKCLAQALAGQTMLAAEGLAAEVAVGAKKGPDGLQAHAWLRHDGKTLLGGVAGDYAELRTGAGADQQG